VNKNKFPFINTNNELQIYDLGKKKVMGKVSMQRRVTAICSAGLVHLMIG